MTVKLRFPGRVTDVGYYEGAVETYRDVVSYNLAGGFFEMEMRNGMTIIPAHKIANIEIVYGSGESH